MTPVRDSRVDTVVAWWQALQPRLEAGRTIPGDRATLAQLRRAGTVMQACMLPATLKLCRNLRAGPDDVENVALIASIMADVQENIAGRFARQLGHPVSQPLLSGLRFQRLIEATETDAKLTAFRRALALAKHRASVIDLAESLLNWNDRRRQRWLYDYYHTNDPNTESAA